MSRTAAAVPRGVALPRPSRRSLAAALAVAALAGGYLGLRESPLVAVEDVRITGVSGPEAPRLRALLADAARDMTTLRVREDHLRAIVEPYPTVAGIEVRTDFPHGMHIAIRERAPVAAILSNGSRVPVAADGTILRGAAQRDVPVVPMSTPPGGDKVIDRGALEAIEALAAAPVAMRERVHKVFFESGSLTLAIQDGPLLRFGTTERLRAKWASALGVLADPSSAGATYVDVRYPERPAAGGLEDPIAQAQAAAGPTEPSTGG